ncbi:hypothetical protein SR1949_45480 [Sphaerospermopsis reniformis]|uniref:Uncharacterized protein n=1 Tax=Sphaerospermopsis reniformis TaxID=531300 RepID=A0A480A4H7_9CYAN|nr:hypothetical protein NIES73_06490 [Sphaerospermopsis kisseleviana NIES-73]GCL39422.1 hypothetical protein SR1949_45480 [Sphaerospermopsis reniformis]
MILLQWKSVRAYRILFEISQIVRLSESGYPGFKDLQDVRL